MSSSPSIRRCRNSGPRTASPAAAAATRKTLGLTDRGDIFSGAALTIILVAITLALETMSSVWTQAQSG